MLRLFGANTNYWKNLSWFLTDYGFEIFKRSNSFFVPHSYREIILNLKNILIGKKNKFLYVMIDMKIF